MNQQQTKIRYGLILQGVLAHALRKSKIAFVETPQYAEGFEKPDFLIPEDTNPKIMIEVHQTEARNAFQMKTLRCITAVTEAKVYFGDELIVVNVLFGDPHTEVPEANLRAMCGLFDHNILLIDHVEPDRLSSIQEIALQLAGTDGVTTSEAADQVAKEHRKTVDTIAKVMSSGLGLASINPKLLPLWQMERVRQKSLPDPPPAGSPTYYKRNILRSLFFTDDQFGELLSFRDPEDLSQEVQDQLVRCKLATITEEMWGDVLEIDSSFIDFLQDPDGSILRSFCEDRLSEDESMRCFFADIQNADRRRMMCEYTIDLISQGKNKLARMLFSDLVGQFQGPLQHTRCWIADLLPLCVDKTHNEFNRLMYQHDDYNLGLGNPFNNITIKSDRLGNNQNSLQIYANVAAAIFYDIVRNERLRVHDISIGELSRKLIKLRIDAAIKLQKLNPLYLVIEAICNRLGLNFEYISTQSLISDLAESGRATGKYKVYHITDGSRTIIANALAPNENPGDKAKEWGARCQAMLYRESDNEIIRSDIDAALMVLDGIWEDDDVARLYRSGWTHVARLEKIEGVLREIFNIKAGADIQILEKTLPVAAEDDDMNPKLTP